MPTLKNKDQSNMLNSDHKKIGIIKEIKNCFFEKINKIGKPLDKLREGTQRNVIINERGDITADTLELQMIMRNYTSTNWITWKKWVNS